MEDAQGAMDYRERSFGVRPWTVFEGLSCGQTEKRYRADPGAFAFSWAYAFAGTRGSSLRAMMGARVPMPNGWTTERLTPMGSWDGAEALLLGMSVQVTHEDVVGDVAGPG